jgi:hypothetical protein
MAENKKSALANPVEFVNFPVDEYVSACIISYQVASLPPNKFSKSDKPVPSVRFLLAGRVKNSDGELTVVRKWTSWMSISYNEKAKLSLVFNGIPNLEELITDDGEGGKLWETPFKIMLEASRDGKYSNVTRIKIGDDKSVLDITYTGKSKLPDGTESFAPYKKVSAYGKLVYLELAVNKEEDGVKQYAGEDLIENPNEEENA